MPEVEIEDYETKQVTREGYACDKCQKGAVDEPLSEDEIVTLLYAPGAHNRLRQWDDDTHRQFRCDEHADVRETVEHSENVASRMERYKKLILYTAKISSSVVIIAGAASAFAIGAFALQQAYPAFVTDPELAGVSWVLSALAIMTGSCIGAGVIEWLGDKA